MWFISVTTDANCNIWSFVQQSRDPKNVTWSLVPYRPDTSFKWSCFAFSVTGKAFHYHSEELPKANLPPHAWWEEASGSYGLFLELLKIYISVFRNFQSDFVASLKKKWKRWIWKTKTLQNTIVLGVHGSMWLGGTWNCILVKKPLWPPVTLGVFCFHFL